MRAVVGRWLLVGGLSVVLSAAAGAQPLPFTGVSLAGGEFGDPKPGTTLKYGQKFIYPNAAERDYYVGKGLNVFRIGFHWEVLQPVASGELDAKETERLKAVVKQYTAKGVIVLLDPHNYARYYGQVVGGAKVSAADFADFWRRLAGVFGDDLRVWFGLVNEPHDMPTAQWFGAAAAAVKAIREAGARNLILVPGNSWTGAHAWTEGQPGQSSASQIGLVKDPLDHFIIEVHQYLDRDNSGTHPEVVGPSIGSQRVAKFVAWCRENHYRAFLGEFGAGDKPGSAQAVGDLLASMEKDRDVWLGWTWWAGGPWWGDYMFTLDPKAGADRPQMAWLAPHLHGGGLPKFQLTVDGGAGGGPAEPAGTVAIAAGPALAGQTFAGWTGDVAWLADAKAAATTVTMPFKDIKVAASWR
jgi:endoglucanase